MTTTARTPLVGGGGANTAEFAINNGKVSASLNDAQAHVIPQVGEFIDKSTNTIDWRTLGPRLRTGVWTRSGIATCRVAIAHCIRCAKRLVCFAKLYRTPRQLMDLELTFLELSYLHLRSSGRARRGFRRAGSSGQNDGGCRMAVRYPRAKPWSTVRNRRVRRIRERAVTSLVREGPLRLTLRVWPELFRVKEPSKYEILNSESQMAL
jgi:hypothetical protein